MTSTTRDVLAAVSCDGGVRPWGLRHDSAWLAPNALERVVLATAVAHFEIGAR